MRPTLLATLLLATFLLATAACGSTASKVCIPGASVACVGAGGCAGGQVCNADGSALGTCVCQEATTAATSTSSSSSTASSTGTSAAATSSASSSGTSGVATTGTTGGASSSGTSGSTTTSGGPGCSAANACDAGIDACAGACVDGACVYPTTTACADGTQCITAGTCNGAGLCAGPSACVPTGTCIDNDTEYSSQTATNPDGTGTCTPSTSPYIPGQCSFNTSTEPCDCGCGTIPSTGAIGCIYNWTMDPTSPDGGRFGSVWASQAGDAWATQSNGRPQGNTIGQVFYERVNGTWTQQTTLPLGSNPLWGSGSAVALTGDQNGDVYGASACSFEDTLFMPAGNCGDAGIWKWSNGTATVEPLAPPSFASACGSGFDFPVTYPVVLGSDGPAFLNSNACGPEIMTESSGQFTAIAGSQLQVMCSATGALWGTSASDVYIAWGCGGFAGGGGIWHYTGTPLSTAPDFAFGSPNYVAAVAGTSDSDIWAVGTQRWHNDGTGWTSSTPPPTGEPDMSLWSVGDGTYFASGNYPGVYHYANGAWNLECLAPGYTGNDSSVSQVAGDSSSDFYAATQTGIFKRQ